MLSISGQVKVLLAAQPTDLRRSFDSLAALSPTSPTFWKNPLGGDFFGLFFDVSRVAMAMPSGFVEVFSAAGV